MNDPTPEDRNPDGTRRRWKRQSSDDQQPLFDFGQTAKEARADAYRQSKPKASVTREQIIAYVVSCGDHGATRDSVSIATGLPIQSVCGPVLTLLCAGRLREDGRMRPTSTGSPAAVFVAVEVHHG